MAKVCEICGKGAVSGNNVSHALNRTKRVFKANLQTFMVLESGKKVKKTVCTKCLKAGKVRKA